MPAGVDVGVMVGVCVSVKVCVIVMDIEDLDDWLAIHQVEHQVFASILDLDNPFNLLDTDWNQEDDFYDWIQQHLLIHEQIARALST